MEIILWHEVGIIKNIFENWKGIIILSLMNFGVEIYKCGYSILYLRAQHMQSCNWNCFKWIRNQFVLNFLEFDKQFPWFLIHYCLFLLILPLPTPPPTPPPHISSSHTKTPPPPHPGQPYSLHFFYSDENVLHLFYALWMVSNSQWDFYNLFYGIQIKKTERNTSIFSGKKISIELFQAW